MAPPYLASEILLMIAHEMREDTGELRYGDFNSFLQVDQSLCAFLNPVLWYEAAQNVRGTQLVLTHLIKINDLARLAAFLDLGADVNLKLPDFDLTITALAGDAELGQLQQWTALHLASDSDNLPMARLLLQRGAAVGDLGFGPLHAAHSAAMVALLVEHGADPGEEDSNERQPSHWYVIRNDLDALEKIVECGADVNTYSCPVSPLHHAVLNNLAAVELLIRIGADTASRDWLDDTPAHWAARYGNVETLALLVETFRYRLTDLNHMRQTPLHVAAAVLQLQTVRFLLEQRPDGAKEVDNQGNTALHLAAACRGAVVAGVVSPVVWMLAAAWPEAWDQTNHCGRTPMDLLVRQLLSEEDVFWGNHV
jgi:ankyrin repeat protein